MPIVDVLLLSLTITIDSFIICLTTNANKKVHYFLIPLIFAINQLILVLIGSYAGIFIERYISSYIKYTTFIIFSFMAMRLLIDTVCSKNNDYKNKLSFKNIILESLIASFDSLFLGIPLALTNTNIFIFTFPIVIATYLLCFIALVLRSKIKKDYDLLINVVGAIILFFFAFKALIL